MKKEELNPDHRDELREIRGNRTANIETRHWCPIFSCSLPRSFEIDFMLSNFLEPFQMIRHFG